MSKILFVLLSFEVWEERNKTSLENPIAHGIKNFGKESHKRKKQSVHKKILPKKNPAQPTMTYFATEIL
jgi:hypothetical protein